MPDLGASIGLARSLAIYYGQPWRRSALRRFYAGLIEPGDLAFDIGAHVGSRSRTLAGLGANVIAVEPQPRFADFIARHVAGNGVTLVREAVGSHEGEATLHVSSRHPTVTSIAGDWIDRVRLTPGFAGVEWDETIAVPMTTLDALVDRYGLPRFCKIDVEGAELDILQGLSRPIRLVAFEYLPGVIDLSLAVVERLSALGPYRFNRVAGERHRFVHGEWLDAAAICADLGQCPPSAGSGDVYARLA